MHIPSAWHNYSAAKFNLSIAHCLLLTWFSRCNILTLTGSFAIRSISSMQPDSIGENTCEFCISLCEKMSYYRSGSSKFSVPTPIFVNLLYTCTNITNLHKIVSWMFK